MDSQTILAALNTGKGLEVKYYDNDVFPYLVEDLPSDAPQEVYDRAYNRFDVGHMASDLWGARDKSTGYFVNGEPIFLLEDTGCEGGPTDAHIIVSVGDYFFQIDYTYNSWDCDYYEDEWFEVKPTIVPTTVYKRV